VINTDARDNGKIGINTIDGIKSTTESDLQHLPVNGRLLEDQQRSQRRKLKVTQCDLAPSGFYLSKRVKDARIGRRLPIDDDTLVKIDKMGRRIGTHRKTQLPQQALQSGDCGALAIGAGNDDRGNIAPKHTKPLGDRPDARQAEIDGFWVQGLEM
jgi:hypothetical protein